MINCATPWVCNGGQPGNGGLSRKSTKRKHKEDTMMDNIILIGFMGSGKSTVGIRLSYRLRRAMEDTDDET